ncbi:tetrapyrrole biosynthesis, uroporphyrinogen III synthase [Stachybotrys elegans]|uniref:Tetrapyrrole biosynthesis, uroporphyrinogen III synthase n=1 Tax=Stachybotrys elegans TaxID=80388 RepID=A0A8K0WUW0_9HYPO|nr:tetrapyrrole biosynthesis, uroporphyrinogen III synthase [Stachybotrys elegans]
MPDLDNAQTATVPVLLLKTRSTPGDAYAELFATATDRIGRRFAPRFVPVLLHRFEDAGLSRLRRLLRERQIGARPGCEYGGMIFTSQRAVEAFAKVVEEGSSSEAQQQQGDSGESSNWPHLQHVPIYSVGPATTRALCAVHQQPPLQIFGEHTGTGEVLASYILDHYGEWYKDRPTKPPLLFLVGEQRRDIIPKTLTNPSLASDRAIGVTEDVVYGTGVMEPFPEDFAAILRETADRAQRWVIVFSPTGCDSMLRGLGMLDDVTGRAKTDSRDGRTFIATIGPTTRDYLIKTFGLEPDVCAKTPTPEGLLQGIKDFTHE